MGGVAYCTVDDVTHELHPTLLMQMREHYERAHREDAACPPFLATIEAHIEKAQACADASLARAYAVPLKKATGIVTSAVCKIAAYFAAAAFSEKEEILRDKYETAVMMLDHLVEAGRASLVDEDPDDGSASTGAGWGSDARIFTSDELRRW